MPPNRAMIAEFVGAFAFIFVGAGTIIVTADMAASLIAVALAHGLILAVMVSATMHISGGQINPAVSIALGTIGKQSWTQAGFFIAAQLAGAAAAAGILKVTLVGVYDLGNLGATLGQFSVDEVTGPAGVLMENPDRSIPVTMVLEIIATFFLMFVIMGTAVDNRGTGRTLAIGGMAIGLTVGANIFFFGPLTGASMNPARSFGPQVVAGAWDMWWVYWLAPIIGAILAAQVYHHAFGSEEKA